MSKAGPVLTIRDVQLDALRRGRVETFVDDLLAYLEAEYPTHRERLGRPGLRSLVERSVEAAAGLGICNEGALGVFTELRLVYGEDLERAPDRRWAKNILRHSTLPDYIKVAAVQDRLSERAGGRVLNVHHDIG